MARRRIAFVKEGEFSHVNPNLIAMFREWYPDDVLDVIDVRDVVPDRSVRTALSGVREYGPGIITGRRSFERRRFLRRNRHYMKRVRRYLQPRIRAGGYAFVFQTQTLWDASTPGVPNVIYTDHTHLANLRYTRFDRQNLNSRAWIDWERQAYHNAVLILVTSHFAEQSLIEDYGVAAHRVVCVYSAMNFEVPPEGQERDESPDPKSILFVGFDWVRKGGPVLLEAFDRVRRTHPDATLTVIGKKEEAPVEGCTFIPRVGREELSDYYRRATIYCMPSDAEPSAAVLAEAAVHRLPVVSTAVGGTTDRVVDGETGYLVPVGDVERLAHALSDLLGDPEKCRRFGDAGRALVLDRFVWARVGEKIKAELDARFGA